MLRKWGQAGPDLVHPPLWTVMLPPILTHPGGVGTDSRTGS